MPDELQIAPSSEIGSLGLRHLKRLWSSSIAARQGTCVEREGEYRLDQLVVNALGLGLYQTLQYLYMEAPTFPEFEDWVINKAGRPDVFQVGRLNADIAELPRPEHVQRWLHDVENSEPVLGPDELRSWEEKGYVVLKNAVSREAAMHAENAIWHHVGADPALPDTWYGCATHGIMVELIQHPALEVNRRAARIHKAFSQLWGTADLWVSADRCGFHPPQREDCAFPGPDLHWDVDFRRPVPFATQGILYLTDTPPEQGALTLVPGFHRKLNDWLGTLKPGADPQKQDLHSLGSVPIGGSAGDMIIWHHALPHGSRPNLGSSPRIVQYINMAPGPGIVA